MKCLSLWHFSSGVSRRNIYIYISSNLIFITRQSLFFFFLLSRLSYGSIWELEGIFLCRSDCCCRCHCSFLHPLYKCLLLFAHWNHIFLLSNSELWRHCGVASSIRASRPATCRGLTRDAWHCASPSQHARRTSALAL